jgi:hypothetical protein
MRLPGPRGHRLGRDTAQRLLGVAQHAQRGGARTAHGGASHELLAQKIVNSGLCGPSHGNRPGFYPRPARRRSRARPTPQPVAMPCPTSARSSASAPSTSPFMMPLAACIERDIYTCYNAEFMSRDLAAFITPETGSGIDFRGKAPAGLPRHGCAENTARVASRRWCGCLESFRPHRQRTEGRAPRCCSPTGFSATA